jgi:hypothetical protein
VQYMAKYLEEFAPKMIHDGRSPQNRFRKLEVVQVTKGANVQDWRWCLSYRDLEGTHQRGVGTHSDAGLEGKKLPGPLWRNKG